MAHREQLKLIRLAREGNAAAQLELGRLYLDGPGAEHNPATALGWLLRALRQGSSEAAHLIASGIPVALARQQDSPETRVALLNCYREGALSGNAFPALAYGNWLLLEPAWVKGVHADAAQLALATLKPLADAGQALAHWLLSCLWRNPQALDAPDESAAIAHGEAAAGAGLAAAHQWLAQHYLGTRHIAGFLRHVNALLPIWTAQGSLDEPTAGLLAAFAQLRDASTPNRLLATLLHRAAESGHREAQFELGLMHGQLDRQGQKRQIAEEGNANLKKAANWLQQAANAGHRDAWYVLAQLYRRPQFSGYSAEQSNACLERAALMGHAQAQLRLAQMLWRLRANNEANALHASYWAWQARQNGVPDAPAVLARMASSHPSPAANRWAELAEWIRGTLPPTDYDRLAWRVLLGNLFDLERAELLLLDPLKAQREHCLVVDIRDTQPRHRRRLVLIDTLAQRKALLQAAKVFEADPATPPEGNYRQRRYRLDRMIAQAGLPSGYGDMPSSDRTA